MFNTLIGRYGGVAGVGGAGVEASGGSEIITSTHKYHVFTSPGTLTLTNSGEVEYLVIAGGGAGGRGSPGNRHGGGGGAGGIRNGTLDSLTPGAYPITVGTGGSEPGNAGSAAPAGADGNDSTFATITSTGGGGGGNGINSSPPHDKLDGRSGGSGGGGASEHHDHSGTGGLGNTPPTTPPQGNVGSNAGAVMPQGRYYGGGGGSLYGYSDDTSYQRSSNYGHRSSSFPQFSSTILAPAIPSALQTAISTTGKFGGGGQGSHGFSPLDSYGVSFYIGFVHGPHPADIAAVGGAGVGGYDPGPSSPVNRQGGAAVNGSGAGGGGSYDNQTAGDGGDGIVIIRYEL
jgi:hypothetical protein